MRRPGNWGKAITDSIMDDDAWGAPFDVSTPPRGAAAVRIDSDRGTVPAPAQTLVRSTLRRSLERIPVHLVVRRHRLGSEGRCQTCGPSRDAPGRALRNVDPDVVRSEHRDGHGCAGDAHRRRKSYPRARHHVFGRHDRIERPYRSRSAAGWLALS